MHDVIIIGAGIAGCTAAVYAERKKMDFLVIAKDFGGQFYESGKIFNYPGIKEIDGSAFAAMFEEQLKFNGIKINIGEEVKSIERGAEGYFRVVTSDNGHEAGSVIIASGSKPKKLGVPGEKEFYNKGVTYCSICDGPLFAGKDIAVIGGGNAALEGVDFTKDIAKKIYLVTNEDKFNAHEGLIEKVEALSKVEIIKNASTKEIYGETFVKGLKYVKDGEEKSIDVEGVIIEIGRSPNTDFAEGFLDFDENKHIRIDCQTRTSVEGVFAAGDCASGNEYQYAIAGGQGCIALLKAARYLAGKK